MDRGSCLVIDGGWFELDGYERGWQLLKDVTKGAYNGAEVYELIDIYVSYLKLS